MNSILPENDWIMVQNLTVQATVGLDAWEREVPQPIVVSMAAQINVTLAGESDLLDHSVSYGDLTRVAQKLTKTTDYASMDALANILAHHLLYTYKMIERIYIRIEKPEALLHAEMAGLQIERTLKDFVPVTDNDCVHLTGKLAKDNNSNDDTTTYNTIYRRHDQIFVKALRINTIIGIHPWERLKKQAILVSLSLYPDLKRPLSLSLSGSTPSANSSDFYIISQKVMERIEHSSYQTVEAMATTIAAICNDECGMLKTTVLIEKPSALRFACAAVQITRSRTDI
ncbi:hypothetical protein BDF19DRAFT_428727 [Syncephalis fuscata]|nr:hypothetical protein BDF19DRAFT_428727 [Syncephalis fuscata]